MWDKKTHAWWIRYVFWDVREVWNSFYIILMCTLPIVWVAFSGVRKSLSPQGTGQVEVKENPPSPRLRRWQPKKLGDRFFVGKFWIYPLPLPRIASHQLEFFNFLFSGDPEKKTHFYLPLLFGWVGGGGVDPMFGQFSPTSMVDVRFLLATNNPPFSPISVAELYQWHWQLNPMPILESS